jgi:hypothetical protein
LIIQAIVEANSDPEYKYLLDWVVGFVFLGTPHRGSATIEFARYVAHFGKWIGLGSGDTILNDLREESGALLELRNHFVRWSNKSTAKVNCTFELHKTSTGFGKEMVSFSSVR